MRSSTARRARQVLLLCGLTLSVIGMHQLVLAAPGTPHATTSTEAHATALPAAMTPPVVTSVDLPEVQPAGHSDSGMDHDLPHLCVAVLCATGWALLLAWLLAAVSTGAPALAACLPPWSRRVWRPPGMAGRSLLTSHCVLRT